MRTIDPDPSLAKIESGHSTRPPKIEKRPLATRNPYLRFGRQLRSVTGHSPYDGELTLPAMTRL
jgi:hypothetical protein